MAHSEVVCNGFSFESNKLKGPPIGGLSKKTNPSNRAKPTEVKILPPAATPTTLSSPFENSVTPKTRGRMRLNRTAPRHLVNQEFEKRLSIPSFRVADQILMDLLIEQKNAGMDPLGEEEEEDDLTENEEEEDEAELIYFDDDDDDAGSNEKHCISDDQRGSSLFGLLQSDCINTPNVLLSDLEANSPQNGHHRKYSDIHSVNAQQHDLSNGAVSKPVDARSSGSDRGSGAGLKINISRWRASASSSSTTSSISEENELGDGDGDGGDSVGGPLGFSGLLRSASAQFHDNMQSSQSFTDEELQSILQREGSRQSSIARKSRLSAADSVILVAQELLDTELQYERHLSNLERLLLGPLSTGYLAKDGVSSVLSQCVTKMVVR